MLDVQQSNVKSAITETIQGLWEYTEGVQSLTLVWSGVRKFFLKEAKT